MVFRLAGCAVHAVLWELGSTRTSTYMVLLGRQLSGKLEKDPQIKKMKKATLSMDYGVQRN